MQNRLGLKLSEDAPAEAIQEMVVIKAEAIKAIMGGDGDGKVNFGEFLMWWQKKEEAERKRKMKKKKKKKRMTKPLAGTNTSVCA